MASAPQKVTRKALVQTFAPPAFAASTPSNARNANEVALIHAIRFGPAARAVTPNGRAAPTAKLAAEESAAWIGHALSVSEMPSSSRACAPSASWLHQLISYLPGQGCVQPARDVDGSQFAVLGSRIFFKLGALTGQVCLFGISL